MMHLSYINEKQDNLIKLYQNNLNSLNLTKIQIELGRQTGKTHLLCKYIKENSTVLVNRYSDKQKLVEYINIIQPGFNTNSLFFVVVPGEIDTFKKLRKFIRYGMRGLTGTPVPVDLNRVYIENCVIDKILMNEIDRLIKDNYAYL